MRAYGTAVPGGPVELEEFKPFASSYSTVERVPFVSPIVLQPIKRSRRPSGSPRRSPQGAAQRPWLESLTYVPTLADLDAVMAAQRAKRGPRGKSGT